MSDSFVFAPRLIELAGPPAKRPLSQLLSCLSSHRGLALLDSAGGKPCEWSLLAFDPLEMPVTAKPGRAFGLASQLERIEPFLGDTEVPWFHGGFIGALAYELGPKGEALDLPTDPLGFPKLVGGFYTDYLLRNETDGRNVLVLGEDPGDDRPSVEERLERLLDELYQKPRMPRVRAGEARRLVPREEHMRRIELAREAIAAGETYQANVTHRFVREVQGSPIDLYRALVAAHPAPYSGYLQFDDGAILSVSPELLLAADPEPGGIVCRTRPIKGTRPRRDDPIDDRAEADLLLRSRKDLAELAMIVDLERNDLGRLARPGGVVVERFPELESYVSVHHLAANVVAKLKPQHDALDALESVFPGGSVTGAPKARTMEILGELEGEGRGFSYGALGFHSLDGRARWNLLIRSPLWRPDRNRGGAFGELSWRVGGGITWASDAADEDDESLEKGRALIHALDDGAHLE